MLPSIRPLPVSGHQNRPYQFLVDKVFRMEAEEFSFKMQVLAGFTTGETVAEDAGQVRRVNFSWLIFTLFTAQ